MDRLKMFSSRKDEVPAPYPDLPDSLRSDSFEMSAMAKTQEARADTAPYLTPYLSLRSRLSQIWINRWTVLLLLVLVRVVILIAQLKGNVGDAKDKALSACTKVEDIGSSMASMPHYLSLGVNNLAAKGIETAVEAMVFMLDIILQGVQGIILFIINFLTATYTCLLTALIKGSLDMVGDVTKEATDTINSLIDKATKEIEDIAGSLEDGINDLTKGIEDSIIGDIVPDIPTVDFSKPVDELKDFDLNADDFVKDVRALNDKIPDFEQVQNLTKEAISIPFDFVRKALNDSYGSYKFDKDVFPLAQKKEMTFCSDNDTLNDFFSGLYKMIDKSRTIFIVILSLLAIAATAPMAWLEIKRWRRQQQHAKLIARNQYDPMDVVYIASRPMTATWGITLGSRFKGKQQILVRWCVAYATSPAAMFVLSLALAGFFSCLCQYILLQAVRKEVPGLANEVGAFADDVVSSLENVSDEWAKDANGVITGLQGDINDDVLGYVANATDAVNDTLTTFVDAMNDGLEFVFDDTILLDPIKTVVFCVIGNKIETLQKGLTWVHDHAKVTLPLFDNDTFSLGAQDSVSGDSQLNTFLASPSDVTTDEVTGAVKHVTDLLHDNLVQEALISIGILLVYVIVVLMGVTRMLAGMAMPDRGRAEGGFRYPVNEHTQGAWHDDVQAPRYEPRPSEQELAYGAHNGSAGEKTMSGGLASARPDIGGQERVSTFSFLDSGRKR